MIFPFLVEAFQIFAQDRVHPLLRMFQLAIKKAWMSLVKGFFALFPVGKKSARAAASPSAELPREVSSWTPAAYGARHRRFAGRLFLLPGPEG